MDIKLEYAIIHVPTETVHAAVAYFLTYEDALQMICGWNRQQCETWQYIPAMCIKETKPENLEYNFSYRVKT